MKPLIGITVWKRTLDTYYGPDNLQTLSTYYTDSIVAAGMVPMLFPSSLDPDEAPRLVSAVDGVLLSGGDDIDPSTYGEEITHSTKVSSEADRFEIAVVEAARAEGKPLLAICRGLQLLNVALGGTLSQEVTTEGGVHEPVSRDHEEMNARRHTVTLEDGSILSRLYGASEVKVNSLHHQGLARISPELVVEGRTDDGLVEAARWGGDWWAVGVQWHPERLEGEHQLLFSEFRERVLSGS
jgi:putative glutamine amidotransferase